MAGDPGGVSERLFGLFLDELDEHVERLQQGLEALAVARPSTPPELVAELFRSAHSLKGAAHATGTRAVAELCHRMEDVLAGVRDGSRGVDDELLDGLTAATDALAAAARRLRERQDVPRSAVRPAIDRLAASSPGPPSATRAAPVRSAEEPSTAQPSSGTTSQPAAVRVAAEKMDELLSRAHELVVTARRSEALVADVASIAARLEDDDRRRALDLRLLRDAALEPAAPDPRVVAALERLDSRSRDVVAEVRRLATAVAGYERGLRSLADEFADTAWRARVVPFTDATSGLARLVRDVAREAGKQVTLEVSAEQVEVDRGLLGTLDDVLRHLVRNAVDHGIETPAERAARGRSPTGTVRVTAHLLSDGIEVAVEDDGRGIDSEAVRQAARRLGVGEEGMDQREVVQALFQPGLSTARRVGAVSGRGVGLDVVRTSVESVGGIVTVRPAQGAGLRIAFTVPVNLSGLRVVLVRAADELVALPSSVVRRLVRLPADGAVVDGREVADLDGELVPVVPLAHALGWVDAAPPASAPSARPAVLAIVPEGAVAVTVDEFVGEQEVVMQAPGPRLAGVSTVLGTAQLEDGSVAVVVSAAAAARAAVSAPRAPVATTSAEVPGPRHVLLVEDTLTTRELERGLLEGAGYSVVAAHDGVHAWELLHQHPVDVVVSDVNMPRMDGIALCHAIRRAPRWAHLPVVLVTSLVSDEDRRRGLEAGADAYLTKSGFDRAELVAALERLL